MKINQRQQNQPTTTLRLLDLDQAKAAVLAFAFAILCRHPSDLARQVLAAPLGQVLSLNIYDETLSCPQR